MKRLHPIDIKINELNARIKELEDKITEIMNDNILEIDSSIKELDILYHKRSIAINDRKYIPFKFYYRKK